MDIFLCSYHSKIFFTKLCDINYSYLADLFDKYGTLTDTTTLWVDLGVMAIKKTESGL